MYGFEHSKMKVAGPYRQHTLCANISSFDFYRGIEWKLSFLTTSCNFVKVSLHKTQFFIGHGTYMPCMQTYRLCRALHSLPVVRDVHTKQQLDFPPRLPSYSATGVRLPVPKLRPLTERPVHRWCGNFKFSKSKLSKVQAFFHSYLRLTYLVTISVSSCKHG